MNTTGKGTAGNEVPSTGDLEETRVDYRLAEAENEADPVLSPDVQRLLGLRLKAAYDELVNQPVPESFLKLLEDLNRRESEK